MVFPHIHIIIHYLSPYNPLSYFLSNPPCSLFFIKSLPSAFWSYTCVCMSYTHTHTAYMCVSIFLTKDTVICCLSLYNPLLFLSYWSLMPYIEFFWLPPPVHVKVRGGCVCVLLHLSTSYFLETASLTELGVRLMAIKTWWASCFCPLTVLGLQVFLWTCPAFYVDTRIYNLVLMHLHQVHLPTKPVLWPLEELLILRDL